MMEKEGKKQPLPDSEIRYLCGKLLDLELDDQEVARLNDLLLTSNSAREYYFNVIQMHSLLGSNLEAVHMERLQTEFNDQDKGTPKAIAELPPNNSLFGRSFGSLLVALLGAFLAVLFVTSDRGDVAGEESFVGRNEIFARVIRTVDVKYSNETKAWQPGNHLIAGEKFEISSGLALLRFENNAEVVVQGPAKLEFRDPSGVFLHFGKVTVRDPGVGQGFVVSTPMGKFINNHVEYGLNIKSDTKAVIKVFVGLVQVEAANPQVDTNSDAVNRLTVAAGTRQALKLQDSGFVKVQSEALEDDNEFIRFLPIEGSRSRESEFAIATDGFGQGKTGALVASSTGGFGWTGPWRNDRLDNSSAAVVFFDGQAISQGSGDGAIWRHVAPDLRTSSPVYFSFVVNVDGSDPVCSVWMALFKYDDVMSNNGEGNLVSVGISDGRFCGRLATSLRTLEDSRRYGDFGNYVASTTHLVVGKLEYDVNGGNKERLSVWVDPSMNDASTPDWVVRYDTRQKEFDTVAIRFWDVEHGTVGRVDDVRVVKSWIDAVK